MIGPDSVSDSSPPSAAGTDLETGAASVRVGEVGSRFLEAADSVDSPAPHPTASTAAVSTNGATRLRIPILPESNLWRITNPASTKLSRTTTKTAGGKLRRRTDTTRCALWRALPFQPEWPLRCYLPRRAHKRPEPPGPAQP